VSSCYTQARETALQGLGQLLGDAGFTPVEKVPKPSSLSLFTERKQEVGALKRATAKRDRDGDPAMPAACRREQRRPSSSGFLEGGIMLSFHDSMHAGCSYGVTAVAILDPSLHPGDNVNDLGVLNPNSQNSKTKWASCHWCLDCAQGWRDAHLKVAR